MASVPGRLRGSKDWGGAVPRRVFDRIVCSVAALALGVSFVPVAVPSAAYAWTGLDRGAVVLQPTPDKTSVDASLSVSGDSSVRSHGPLAGQSTGASQRGYVDGEVLVKFKTGVMGTTAALAAYRAVGATKIVSLDAVEGLELAKLDPGVSVETAVKAFEAMPNVEYAQPNYIVNAITVVPNDGFFEQLWGLNNIGPWWGPVDADIDAPEAWDFMTGSSDVVVAVIDTGIDYRHPDLVNNLWVNAGELNGVDGFDDDGNGYSDDIYGYDFVNEDGDPYDDNGHGTHCAGTIGAEGNNALGVVGVNWDVSIMSVKVADADGNIADADIIQAIGYIDAMGIDICSCSWGGQDAFDKATSDAIAGSEALFVFAAGNDSADNDVTPYYPAGYELPNVIAVGASTATDTVASFSNYGATTVDVFAPGDGIMSTVPFGGFDWIVPNDVTWSDGFSSLGNWYNESGTWRWALSSARFVSSPTSLSRVNYADNEASFIDSAYAVSLAGTANPSLSFQLNCNTESGYDFVLVGVYDPSIVDDPGTPQNEQWPTLGQYSGYSSGWVQCAVDLSPYAGDSVYPWFGLVSDEGVSGGYVYIDDAKITRSACTPVYSSAYATWSGTSMAAPHVAGLAALLLARNPGLTSEEMKADIMSAVDVKAAFSGLCVSNGRINAWNALAADNAAPIAVHDEYETLKNGTLTVAAPGVLANDSDSNGDTLRASVVNNPAHGTLVMGADGSFAYTPTPGWSGTDHFDYLACDAEAESQPTAATITVVDGALIEDNAAGVTFDRFVPSAGAAYSGGTYTYGRWTGTRIESRFTGTKIAWYGPKQPSYGKADVYIDGVYKATVDCYAPSSSATVSAKLWESATLGAGAHTVSIRLTGAKNAASVGYIVVVDKLVVTGSGAANPQARANESAGTFSGAWIPTASTTYTDGTYRYSRWAGAKISYTFTGTKVAWIGPRCWNYGRADVYIDGVKKATVSQYGALGWRYRVWESAALAAGQHTIEIRVLGTKEAASTNTIIVVDGFDVKP